MNRDSLLTIGLHREQSLQRGYSMASSKILTIKTRLELLDHVDPVAAALFGAGILQKFKNGEVVRLPPTADAVEVTCDETQAGYAKEGFVAAGFEVPTAAGPAPRPAEDNPITLTVTPALPDTDPNYPLGAEATGRLAAKALYGACVTQPIPPNNDAYLGDPATSMQVRCNQADVAATTRGFGAAKFIVK
jgi:hypothetical protein